MSIRKLLKIWDIAKIPLAAVLTVIAWVAPIGKIASLVLFVTAFVVIGYEYAIKAFKTVIRGRIFDENLLMLIAAVAAFVLGEYPEGIAVLILGSVGELFEDYAVNRSRKNVQTLLSVRPEVAHVKRGEEYETVDPSEVVVGDVLLVKAGERVPVDGVVVKGKTHLDTSALTGESVPRGISEGQEVLSGCIVLDGVIEIRAEKAAGESAIAKIVEMVSEALGKKAKTESFIAKFAAVYTPTVVGLAVVVAVVGGLVTGAWTDWIYRAVNFLVVSCPCALVISVPLAFFNNVGLAGKRGILIKGSGYIEKLAKMNVLFADKTGTITEGRFVLTKTIAKDEEQALSLARALEKNSNHPVAKAIVESGESDLAFDKVEEIAGYGIMGEMGDKKYYIGNRKLLEKLNIAVSPYEGSGTATYLTDGETLLATFVVKDGVKATSKEAVERLSKRGVKVRMLSGDGRQAVEETAREVGIEEFGYELLPQDKLATLRQEKSDKKSVVGFVGDGINDAPALASADVGIAMGSAGTDVAIETADVVVMKDDLNKIDEAVRISRFNMRLVWENIVFSLGVKVAVLVLSVIGLGSVWLAIFGDVGVSVIAILNAMRRPGLREGKRG
ncbi:MAG: cadmium-translocating P-type ATPase [Clostridia bacterium]|nr:cadmium-translocating P-type ATPase [Clostridia bacterium]